MKKKVLMTGANGFIGSRIRPLMREWCDFRATDVRPVEDEEDSRVADITRLSEVEPLMEGIDVVVHMAIASARDFGDRIDAFNEAQLDVNVKGTYNVLEAARRAGVKRVICASSVMVVWGYEEGRYVSLRDPARPSNLYAATKYFVEVQAEFFARVHGLPCICWRIGQPADHAGDDFRTRSHGRDGGVMVSFVDIANGFLTAMENESVHFGVYNLVSDNPRGYCDASAARHDLGFEPVHRFTREGVETLRPWP